MHNRESRIEEQEEQEEEDEEKEKEEEEQEGAVSPFEVPSKTKRAMGAHILDKKVKNVSIYRAPP